MILDPHAMMDEPERPGPAARASGHDATESEAMSFLDDSARRAQAAVEQKFLFRKIGLPFDYASSPDDFPAKAFATAKEARANLPNPQGLGGGFHWSCRNHALLFDAYLLRIELGIEGEGDEGILDRLIGGLIRLDTVAPKSFLVGGLAPDGRGFYALPRRENHAAWAFAAMRGLGTAAISPESQEKFRSIIGKWIERLRREKFRLHTVDGKPAADGDISRADPDAGPFLLAALITAAKASGDAKDYEAYAAAAEESGRARLAPYSSGDVQEDIHALLWRQAALAVAAENDPDADRAAVIRSRMHENAQAASRRIAAWREWDGSLADAPLDLDWRKFPKASLEESPYGFTPPDSWERLEREKVFETSLAAMYTMLLAGDADLLEPRAPEMEECLLAAPWDKLASLNAIAPAIAVHARGVDMNLWDKTLYESRREPPSSETSFAAKYMEPDYDEVNPEKAGHREPPPGKAKAEQAAKGEGGTGTKKRRRRRRR